MSNAAGYIRVSLEEQARDGYSLDAQERAIRAYCEAHGWPLDEVFADRGISGKNIDGRPELRRLLEGAEARAFTHVIVWKLDRLGRKVRDLSDICDRFDRRGIGLVSIQESFDTSTAAGRAFRNMLATMAELERDTIIDYLCPWDRASEREAKAKCATVARVCCGIAGGRSSLLRDSQYGSVSRQPAHITPRSPRRVLRYATLAPSCPLVSHQREPALSPDFSSRTAAASAFGARTGQVTVAHLPRGR